MRETSVKNNLEKSMKKNDEAGIGTYTTPEQM